MTEERGLHIDAEPRGNRTRRRKILLVAAVAAASAGILSVAFWTDGAVLLGAGAGLGAWLGVYFGNKKAREVDAYREEWLAKRAGRANPTDDNADGAAGRAPKPTDGNKSEE